MNKTLRCIGVFFMAFACVIANKYFVPGADPLFGTIIGVGIFIVSSS